MREEILPRVTGDKDAVLALSSMVGGVSFPGSLYVRRD